ncbi:ABC transporter permease/substrate-binding protein [Lactococcus garvieae]|uniref:L-proline glycine betaine binding ABC transporter protein ProX / Osmotic adaptation n=1 Tax=Lactococcus garvieae DCC43 TaxID=1231377 RepID=K2PJP5_9LACT|nr:ABC transporter permease/substrate-binding protein [Lactococcus garvieae]EKF50449.1 L-proline glycine betaine binding ABC transporter protein ProX / Osmotic adaptation [Lactococcus garvieae DCC43]
MNNLITTFQQQEHQFWQALLQHIQISLISLFIAILIALPLALLLRRYPKMAEPLLQITGIFQTIPSLALLGLLIPFIGIGSLPAIVALVVYALFPIIQNTYTGLQQIDKSLIEAATAFGMNRRERLMKFELALAMPFIMAGIRTSAVMIIGTATLAALIGAGGLGNFILLGINSNDVNLILIGAISSALLAVLFSTLLRFLEKAKIRTILISFFAGFLLLLGSYYNPQATNHPQITIAGKLGAEPTLLINMYKEVIEKNSDIEVTLKPNFGDTTFLYNALKSDKIDIYPEFSGTVLTTFLKQPTQSTDPEKVYEEARAGIDKLDNFTYLSPMEFQDTYALAVKTSYAQKHNLKNISDLSRLPSIKAGFDLEFANRQDGYKGIQSLYGLNFDVKTMQTSLIYNALKNSNIDVAQVYSTDSQIKQYQLTVLKDDKNLFPPYQAAPLMSKELLKKHPQLEQILNKLAGQITNQEMIDMNYAVNVEQKDPATVAHDFLEKHNLL